MSIGGGEPVRCKDCVNWRNGPPKNCVVVPTGIKRRSLAVVGKHLRAEADGCIDYQPRPWRRFAAWLAGLVGAR